MSTRTPPRKGNDPEPFVERRVNSDTAGSLTRLKGALARPLALERRGLQVHVVLVERRKAPRSTEPPTLEQVRAELRARLVAQEHEHTAQLMRHLVFVHDELGRKGWDGVGTLPSRVLNKARVQAEMLASEEPSPALDLVIERLRPLQVAAGLREERRALIKQSDSGDRVEVSEATHEEFEEMERSWVDTVLPEQPRPDLAETETEAVPPASGGS